jgi:hypothetical protein
MRSLLSEQFQIDSPIEVEAADIPANFVFDLETKFATAFDGRCDEFVTQILADVPTVGLRFGESGPHQAPSGSFEDIFNGQPDSENNEAQAVLSRMGNLSS